MNERRDPPASAVPAHEARSHSKGCAAIMPRRDNLQYAKGGFMGKSTRVGALLAAAGASLLLASANVGAQQDEAIQPIPSDLKFDEKKVWLGQKLFRDTRMSKDNS